MEPVYAHKGRKHPADTGGACATGPAPAAKARQFDGSISPVLAGGPDWVFVTLSRVQQGDSCCITAFRFLRTLCVAWSIE
jgi:hypothetical protein